MKELIKIPLFNRHIAGTGHTQLTGIHSSALRAQRAGGSLCVIVEAWSCAGTQTRRDAVRVHAELGRSEPSALGGTHKSSCTEARCPRLSQSSAWVPVAQSCPTLQPCGLYSPWDSPGQNTGVGSSQPRNWTGVSCTAGRFFTSWATREARPSTCSYKIWSSGFIKEKEAGKGCLPHLCPEDRALSQSLSCSSPLPTWWDLCSSLGILAQVKRSGGHAMIRVTPLWSLRVAAPQPCHQLCVLSLMELKGNTQASVPGGHGQSVGPHSSPRPRASRWYRRSPWPGESIPCVETTVESWGRRFCSPGVEHALGTHRDGGCVPSHGGRAGGEWDHREGASLGIKAA